MLGDAPVATPVADRGQGPVNFFGACDLPGGLEAERIWTFTPECLTIRVVRRPESSGGKPR